MKGSRERHYGWMLVMAPQLSAAIILRKTSASAYQMDPSNLNHEGPSPCNGDGILNLFLRPTCMQSTEGVLLFSTSTPLRTRA